MSLIWFGSVFHTWQVRGTYELFILFVLANGCKKSDTEVDERRWVGGFETKTCWGKSTSSLTILYIVQRLR